MLGLSTSNLAGSGLAFKFLAQASARLRLRRKQLFKPGVILIMVGTPFHHNMVPASPIPHSASADACASAREAGIGGLLRLNGNIVAWFSFAITLDEAQQHFSWVSDSMQKHINVWELLGQFALAYCLDQVLPQRNHAIEACFSCDNTSAEAAHLKALSTSAGMCQVVAAFFRFQRLSNMAIHIQHISGMWNDEADALSRFKNLSDYDSTLRLQIPWQFLTSPQISRCPEHANFPRTLS